MSDTVHAATQKQPQFATQLYLRIGEIHDNTIVLKNGGLRAVIAVGSVNINLKSDDEQTALVYSYQNLLNSLEFPIQIVVKSRKLDITDYLGKLTTLGKKQTNPLLKNQTYEYTEYIRRLVEYTDIMAKEFYVVVPYDPLRSLGKTTVQKFWDYIHPADSATAFRQRRHEFADFTRKLNERVEQARAALENCGLSARQLTTKELIELFYDTYNPVTARNERLPDLEKTDLVTDTGTVSQPA